MGIYNPSFGLLRRRRRRRMTAGSLRFLLGALVLGTLAAAIGTSSTNSPLAQTRACQPSQAVSEGWSASFVAGCLDRKGKVAGGSQIMHLVPHKGVLFAASGYWMDKRNVWYGGKDPAAGWAQVLRLPGPGEPWEVDLNLGPQHLRPELLKSLTFRLDGNGRPLPVPDTLLIASTYEGSGNRGVSFFVRNDERGAWTTSKVINGDTGQRGENNSVRAAAVYRDRVTGLESIFLSVGILGIYAGRYDPSRPGKISWASAPEPGTTTGTRILSIVEANDSLFFSEGTRIFRRIDGPSPRYVEIANLSAEASSGTDPPRAPGRRWVASCVWIRSPMGRMPACQETCLAEQISKQNIADRGAAEMRLQQFHAAARSEVQRTFACYRSRSAHPRHASGSPLRDSHGAQHAKRQRRLLRRRHVCLARLVRQMAGRRGERKIPPGPAGTRVDLHFCPVALQRPWPDGLSWRLRSQLFSIVRHGMGVQH
jgi:hypothetical protein